MTTKTHLGRPVTLQTMQKVATIVLGGGRGSRLHPLTASRSKPALSIGGMCRLIDFPLSNAFNSGCRKVFVLTQFLAASLHQHITTSFRPDRFAGGFVDLLSCEQKPASQQWYQGTADAVRQNLPYFLECPVDYFLIVSGDQIYHMDFSLLVEFAEENQADLVVACQTVEGKLAKRMGIMKINDDRQILDFIEKPATDEMLEPFAHQDKFIGSMGIYLFKKETLIEVLTTLQGHDFGKDLIPQLIKNGAAYSYPFEGYWEDIGTIESFYNANLNLTNPNPAFNAYNELEPLFTKSTDLPGAKIAGTRVTHSLVGQGSLIEAEEIYHSVLGPRSIVGYGTKIYDTYVMGNEFYHPPVHTPSLPLNIGIGKNCLIKKAILDENILIGNHVELTNKKNLDHYNPKENEPGVYIRDGIIIVTRGTTIPPHYTL